MVSKKDMFSIIVGGTIRTEGVILRYEWYPWLECKAEGVRQGYAVHLP